MPKILIIDYTKCTGCRLCELVCSVKKTKVSNPSRARIHIVKWEDQGLEMPMLCQQCEAAPCQSACPTRAIYQDELLDRIVINCNLCIGCKICITACPFGAINIDSVTNQIVKCDLCDGDPLCAQFCPTDAITYVEPSRAITRKKRVTAGKLFELMKKFVSV